MLHLRKYNYMLKNVSFSPFSTFKLPVKIKVAKWDINYVKVGRGPYPVLCMPGALATVSSFRPQIEGFDRDKFTLVVWDPPGYGKSRPPDKEFEIDVFEKDADYAFEFMKALQIPSYSLVGWSDGGISALIHAAKYPRAMRKLVVFGTRAFIPPEEMKTSEKLRDTSKWSQTMKDSMKSIYGDTYIEYWNKWIDLYEAIYKHNNGNFCSHLLKDIKCPTFILYGEKDPGNYAVHTSELLAKIPDARLHLYLEGKHNLQLEYPDDFNKRVQEFLFST